MSAHLTSKATTRFASLLMMLSAATAGSAAEMPVDLGSAANFVVVAATNITNASGPTVVVGNVALFPGTSMTGFPPGIVTGNTEINNPIAQAAQEDLTAAYIDAAGRDLAPISVSGNLGGTTLYPGLYKSTSSLAVSSGILTLDGQGDPNAVFIIQMESTFTMTSGQQMVLAGGAKSANIYWVVGSSAVFETTSVSYGNWLAQVSITIENGARFTGRALARTGAVTVDFNEEFIPSPPYVNNVTSTIPDGTYMSGAIIPIQIEFSEAVTVTGFPELALNTNPGASAVFTSGSGSTTLNFDYEVFSPEATSDLDQFSSSALTLNGGTIESVATLAPADLLLADPFTTGSLGLNKDIVIASEFPHVVSILRVDPNPTNLEFVRYDVTFSENVFDGQPPMRAPVGNYSILVTDGTFSTLPAIDSISGIDGTNVRRVTVNTGENDQPDATFRMDLSSLVPPIFDTDGNEVSSTYERGETYTVDTLRPYVLSIERLNPTPTSADTVDYFVTFSEPVDGVSGSNFSFATLAGTFLIAPSFNAISGSEGTATRTVTVNTGLNSPGGATFRMDLTEFSPPISDSLGNELDSTFNSGDAYSVVKGAPPAVVSINRLDPSPTAASSVRYLVTFSESVDGVTESNFGLAVTSGTFSFSPSIASVSGMDGTETREVTVNTGFNNPPDATFRLDLTSVVPAITPTGGGVPLFGTFTSGESYTVDKSGLSVVAITRLDPSPTSASTVGYRVTFSEPVDGVASGNFSYTITDGTFSVSPSFASISGQDGTSTRDIIVNTGVNESTTATFRMDLSSLTPPIAGVVTSRALLSDTFSTGERYSVDKTGPSPVSLTRMDDSPTNSSTVRYMITFNEPVTGVAMGNFSTPTTQGSFSTLPSITSVAGADGTATRTVTISTGTNTLLSAAFRLSLSSATPAITDALGNQLTSITHTGLSYIVDKSAPTVVSITAVDPSTTNADMVEFEIKFSENVDGVDLTNLSITTFGGDFLVAPTLVSVSGLDGTNTRRVMANTGTPMGTRAFFRTNLSAIAPAITDRLGNTLTITHFTGQSYCVDKVAPALSSISRMDPNPTGAATVRFKVSFTESLVMPPTADNFVLNTTDSLVGCTIDSIISETVGDPYIVTVSTGTGEGELRLDLTDASGLNDAATNPMAGIPYTSGQAYTVSRPASVLDWAMFDN